MEHARLTIPKNAKIFVAGHSGMVGSALVRKLSENGYCNVVTKSRQTLDLTHHDAVEKFFQKDRPEYVIDAAAKVGGIHSNNTYPADFIRDNLQIQTNLIDNAHRSGVKKFVFLGSSCIYPKMAPQPLSENSLLTGPLEPTNQWYAIAKIAGIKMCQAYRKQHGFDAICLMPTNLYGPSDNFNLESSHVLPALIRKFHNAKLNGSKSAVIWGTGTPQREFLHVDDLADACVFLMENYSADQIINVGTGKDISIRNLAELIREIVGFRGDINFDTCKPDGTPRKLLDMSRMQCMGWQARISLSDGIASTYEWFLRNQDNYRA